MSTAIDTLRITLMALLPKDGTPLTVAALAAAAGVSRQEVTASLIDEYLQHGVDFDVRADAFSARRKGHALPRANTPRKDLS